MYKIFKIINNCKFIYKNPKINDLVVLDTEGIEYLNNVLKNRNYFKLTTRFKNLKTIYFTPKVIFFSFLFFRGNIFLAYLSALINIINPRVVITYVDHSEKFHKLALLFKHRVKFLAIQNATKDYEINLSEHLKNKKTSFYQYKKNYFVPYLFTYGQFEINFFKKKKIKVINFKKIGSLKVSNFKRIKKKNLINGRRYDICLIADTAPNYDEFFQLKGLESGFVKTIKFTIRFCKENKKKIIIPMKRYLKKSKSEEISFFKKYLNESEFKFLLKNSVTKTLKDKYLSYLKIYESNVTVSCASSMLREALSLKKKIMVCNFTPTKIFDFPINKFFFLKNPSYQQFEKELKKTLLINDEKYFKILGKYKNYLIEDSNMTDANDEVNLFLDKFLKIS